MTHSKQASAPRAAGRLRSALLLLGLATIGAISGYLLANLTEWMGFVPALDLSGGQLIALLLLLLPIWFLVVLAHEAGHLAGGVLAGFKPFQLVVGPLKLLWVEGRVRAELNRSLLLAGGVAVSLPPDGHNLIRRMLLMVVGGPTGSLLVALLALAAMAFADGLPAAALLVATSLGLIITLVTLVPMRSGGFYSDGARILMLLRGGPQAERWSAVALLLNASLAGRLRELDASLVARATALRDGTLDAVSAAFMAYSVELTLGDVVAAGAQLDYTLANLEVYPAAFRPAILVEAAYFTARHRGDAGTARAYLEQTNGSALVEAHTRHRAEAAVLRAEGHAEASRAAAEAGLIALQRARLGSAGVIEAELLAELR